MTALLEFKQKIKGIYAQYEMYLLPLLKFVLALVYFSWINTNMGYMTALDNIFIVLILSLICCILPSGMMIFAGFALMVGHCYALGIEVAAFLLVLILFMMILFLRFSSGKNIVLVFTPLAFAFDIPVLLPIGCRTSQQCGISTSGSWRRDHLLFCPYSTYTVAGSSWHGLRHCR